MTFTEAWLEAYKKRTGKKVISESRPATKQDKPKRTKYGNIPTTVDDIWFPSKHEADRYCELKFMLLAGVIKDLKLQVKFPLIAKNEVNKGTSYIADFTYIDLEKNEMIVEDAKGKATPDYKIKKKLMFDIYGIEVREV